MKWLICYSVRINGTLLIKNTILPDELPPMNWIAISNRENIQALERNEKPTVIREYALINYWHISDFEANKWEDDGSGYLQTVPAKERGKQK